jgi:Transcriptional regulator, AbiEi antitoxin
MSYQLPEQCREILALQRGVISRRQALRAGIDTDTVGRRLRTGEWRLLQRGVYAAFTGEPSREAVLWAVALRAGPGAALSHHSAAELFRLTDRPSPMVHVSVPAARHIGPLAGAVIHRSIRMAGTVHPSLLPPRTRIENTVLDLVNQASSFGSAFDWASAACQRRLTTAGRLCEAMNGYARMRWRAELADALTEIADGVHSRLERGYAVGVERRHRLPAATRQARTTQGPRVSYLDNLYDEYLVCVELDGNTSHPAHRRWLDISRDNAGAAAGLVTLRYGWVDVMHRPCATAVQVGTVLRARGWPGTPQRCGANCLVPR